MIIVSGSASQLLSKTLADKLGCAMANVEVRRFPDTECYVRIHDDLAGEDIVVVQTSFPDDKVIELFLLQEAALTYDVKSLVTVVPYFGYARQDKQFNSGEPVSAKTLAKHLQLAADSLITVDIHEEKIMDWFDIPAVNVSGMPQIGEYLRNMGPEIIIAPDKGAVGLAQMAAEVVGCAWD